ncbi:hypothetical protein [Arsenicicoccus dermatophilus]|uniref:hypothetical protein n=1 Tax=Arsenicicoccus dermatophilus TaxID=1076331 RepID=UPI003916F298
MSLLQPLAPRPTGARVVEPTPQRPHLEVVRQARRRATQVPFVVLGATLLTLGLLALLVLNLTLSQGSFTLHDLRERSAELKDTSIALRQDLNAVSSPGTLAARAEELGMGPANAPAFLDPATGTVSGVAEAASRTGELTVVSGSQAVAPQLRPEGSMAAAAQQVAGLGLGNGLLGGLAALPAAR